MEDKQQKDKNAGSCCVYGAAPFILGLILALTFGWWAFPNLMYSQKQQPVAFNHAVHIDLMECADCHYLREDGIFAGIPSTADCASCHVVRQGDSRAEADYIANYVDFEKEVDWLIHQKQPDNVFFSHAAHWLENCQTCHVDFTEKELCTQCHPSVEELDKQIPYLENRLTGYSKKTMKMWQCERCHALPEHYGITNANNACYTCHK